MTGEAVWWTSERLKRILRDEFLEEAVGWQLGELERAAAALSWYGSVEDFLLETGWERDNPEYASETYLTEHRICRWIDGKFVYLSRLVWKDGVKESKNLG